MNWTAPALANFGNIEGWLIVVGFALLVFGPKKIPELMRGLGRGVGELQKGIEDGKRMLHDATHIDHEASTSSSFVPPSDMPKVEEPSTEVHTEIGAPNTAAATQMDVAPPKDLVSPTPVEPTVPVTAVVSPTPVEPTVPVTSVVSPTPVEPTAPVTPVVVPTVPMAGPSMPAKP